jgi:hypothetical protein
VAEQGVRCRQQHFNDILRHCRSVGIDLPGHLLIPLPEDLAQRTRFAGGGQPAPLLESSRPTSLGRLSSPAPRSKRQRTPDQLAQEQAAKAAADAAVHPRRTAAVALPQAGSGRTTLEQRPVGEPELGTGETEGNSPVRPAWLRGQFGEGVKARAASKAANAIVGTTNPSPVQQASTAQLLQVAPVLLGTQPVPPGNPLPTVGGDAPGAACGGSPQRSIAYPFSSSVSATASGSGS